MINRNDLCWCGSGKKWKKCHFPQKMADQLDLKKLSSSSVRKVYASQGILLKTDVQIEGIRKASQLAANILDELCNFAKIGVTTNQLDLLSRELHKKAGAKPACLGYGYPPFPKTICTSLNEVICHGIPDDRPLQEGDIINIDVTSILNGYYGDCSRMVVIGKTTPERQKVVDVSYECLMRSIAILKPGVPVCEIGAVIEDYAHSQGCSVVYQFVGHGVGVNFHEEPQIFHNRNDIDIPLVPGMTFTIEPMINAGSPKATIDQHDKWTARTIDGKASAQWEHTILITENGYEILTLPSNKTSLA